MQKSLFLKDFLKVCFFNQAYLLTFVFDEWDVR